MGADGDFKGIKSDSNINRLLDACALKETDRIPAFEHTIMKSSMEYVLGEEKMREILSSEDNRRVWYYYSDATSYETFETSTKNLWNMYDKNFMQWHNIWLPPEANLEILSKLAIDCATPSVAWNPGDLTGGLDDKTLANLKFSEKRVENMVDLTDWCLETFKRSPIGVGPLVRSCLCNTYEVLGMEKFFIKVHRDRKTVDHFMDLFTEFSVQVTKELSKREIDCLWVVDDLCSNHGSFTNPNFIKEEWVPRTNRIIKPMIDSGIPVYMHSCGNVEEMIPIFIEMGITALQPIQPNCNDIYKYKEQYGDKIALVGNMDLVGPLSFGTLEEIADDTNEHLDKLSHGGGYVVGSSVGTITNTVPPENYLEMIRTTQKTV